MVPDVSAGPPGPAYDGWMHGEAARLLWSKVSHDEHHVRARLKTPDSGFLLDSRVTLQGAGLRVETTARNDSGEVRSITFGEHPCFQREVFAGGRIDLVAGGGIDVRPSAAHVYGPVRELRVLGSGHSLDAAFRAS